MFSLHPHSFQMISFVSLVIFLYLLKIKIKNAIQAAPHCCHWNWLCAQPKLLLMQIIMHSINPIDCMEFCADFCPVIKHESLHLIPFYFKLDINEISAAKRNLILLQFSCRFQWFGCYTFYV